MKRWRIWAQLQPVISDDGYLLLCCVPRVLGVLGLPPNPQPYPLENESPIAPRPLPPPLSGEDFELNLEVTRSRT